MNFQILGRCKRFLEKKDMRSNDFQYHLPHNKIAQFPLPDRTASKLLWLNRTDGTIKHHIFRELPQILKTGDCVVLNNTRVLPVRLFGRKEGGGAQIEILLLKKTGKNIWRILAQRAKRLKEGVWINISPDLKGEVIKDEGEGIFQVRFETTYPNIETALYTLGKVPLPPYIKRDKGYRQEDFERYQTVYAEHVGSAAAPTAGFHFSRDLLKDLETKGIRKAVVTLHVGLDTFRPIMTEWVEDHKIHKESYRVLPKEAAVINDARKGGGRVIAVGTTTVRTLETCANEDGVVMPGKGDTDLFIYPGYQFRVVDALITNFHLPESTLLVMIAAFIGSDSWKKVYQEAIDKGYRFYSYGDAMLIT